MTDEEKMLWMFKEVNGEITGACYVEVHEDKVHLMKHGNYCWGKNKAELVFDYLTKHLD